MRFAEGGGGDDSERPQKRPRRRQEDNDEEDPPASILRQKKPKSVRDRMNEDEMDDVDDWEDDEEKVEGVASERERLEARRARREQREIGGKAKGESVNAQEPTNINDTTSLATEGVEIEPFHMRNERSDGTGYFDGDTYVFRKRTDNEEPDAWLESLEDGAKADSKAGKSSFFKDNSSDSDNETAKVESRSKEEWYAVIVPLLGKGTETIMQAVVRYGQLLKRQPLKKNRKNKANASSKQEAASSENNTQSESFKLAQASLNQLTEAANALLGMGDADIYQKTKDDLQKLLPKKEEAKEAAAAGSSSKVTWEYKGLQDGQIHGPYTGEQMKAWVGAGYFVGAQAVQIRSIREKEKSTADDLLSDLMDDDDDDEDKADSSKEIEYVRGEWQSSDKADYDAV